MRFSEIREEDFKEFAESNKRTKRCRSFLQSVEMYRRYKAKNVEVYLLGVKEKDEILAAGLVVSTRNKMGRKIFKMPGGPLLDYDEERGVEILEFFSGAAKKFLRKKGGLVLEISPNIVSQPRDSENNVVVGVDHLGIKNHLRNLGYKYLGEYESCKWTYILEIEGKSAEELFRDFRANHRYNIRYAKREGVKVRELQFAELGILKKIAAEAGERHGFRDPEINYYREMAEAFAEKAQFMVAEKEIDGKMVPLAAALFIVGKREIVYLYSGSVRKYQKFNGAYLLQWEMIKKAAEMGCERYNFYGVYPLENKGVYLFKKGFRGRVEELLGTFALPIGLLGEVYVRMLKYREFGEMV